MMQLFGVNGAPFPDFCKRWPMYLLFWHQILSSRLSQREIVINANVTMGTATIHPLTTKKGRVKDIVSWSFTPNYI
jgi:hypothetical protein